MTKEALAAQLTGREIGNEITKAEELAAKGDGLVVIFGASDDLMEIRGAADEEIDCYGGTTAAFTANGLLANECSEGDECPNFRRPDSARDVVALWCAEPNGPSWTYKTDIPHVTFDITEEGDLYCRGIVFALADVSS